MHSIKELYMYMFYIYIYIYVSETFRFAIKLLNMLLQEAQ